MLLLCVLRRLLTPLSSPALITLTHEVAVKGFNAGGVVRVQEQSLTRRDHVTRGGASPGASPVAMAKLEAAALGGRPQ